MDIFDLKIRDFEKKIDELLESISNEKLFEELMDNGLIVDQYDRQCYYIEEDTNNVWVHNMKTSRIKKKINIFFRKNEEVNLLEAA